ncbi:MAG: hypothetical protein ACRC3Y_10390 [Romboutsia sp.]|uniref:hypothetical protein n=1 Tax=Romboutsia sp. TaxID=1965302 RepID=UPI003F33C1BD
MGVKELIRKTILKDNKDGELNREILEYIKYRDIGKYLNNDILKYVCDTPKFKSDLTLLNVLKTNDICAYEEDELNLYGDFILYEKTSNKKSGLDLYLENNYLDGEELRLINAMKSAYTSLYKTIDIDRQKCSVLLEKIDTGEEVSIIDIGLSKTLNNECLVFTRLIRLDNINLTSGMVMLFDNNHKDFLQRVLKKEMRKSNLEPDIQKFISYIHLSRKHALPIYKMAVV